MQDFEFKIGIIGPSRVGKTSLIAALLKDTQKLLEGTPARMQAGDTATERRLAKHRRELAGNLAAREFEPGAVAGTQEPFAFHLRLTPGEGVAAIDFGLLDYPGGWLDAVTRPPDKDAEWKKCQAWLEASQILIIPVEAAVLMEAKTGKEKRAVVHNLHTPEVEEVARGWAKSRAVHPTMPALAVFCPVKCEKYLDDNGGYSDLSDRLQARVQEVYAEVIDAIRDEAPGAELAYVPVDTIGCVELRDARWLPDEANPEAPLMLHATYDIRPGEKQPSQRVKGAGEILIATTRKLVEMRQEAEQREAEEKEKEAQDKRDKQRDRYIAAKKADELADQDEGWWKNFANWWNGEDERRREDAAMKANLLVQARGDARQASEAAAEQRRSVEALTKTVERLAKQQMDKRWSTWGKR